MTGMQAAGQRTFELNEQGKTAGESLARGTVSGVIEAATEKLPLEQMSKILHSGRHKCCEEYPAADGY